jgi:hypothetical protein
MITSVYKYRSLQGIIEYKIINGEFGVDSTLHLQDTSCKHYGPNCEIEVMKSESGDCYQFSKALNSSAEEYVYFHNVEEFWATKRDAYIDAIRTRIKNCQKNIANEEKRLADTQNELASINGGDVHRLTSTTAKLGTNCYIHDEGNCRIIGIITFEDGATGYLTDSNYASSWDDEGGDRIILVDDKNGCNIVSENGDIVFLSKEDNDKYKNNNKIALFNKMIENCQMSINQSTARLKNFQDAFDKRDTLSIDELTAIANS